MARYKNTDEEIRDAVKNSQNLRQAMLVLDRNPKGGGGYDTMRKYIKEMKLDTSHFTAGQGWRRGKVSGPKRPLSDYLSNKFSVTSYELKRRLIREGLKRHQCEKCKNTEWLGSPIPLELHHINGNHKDNQLSNIELLCPNCHAGTDNFAGKSKGKYNGQVV